MRHTMWEVLRPFPLKRKHSERRQIVMLECTTEPYNLHLLRQVADERGNDGGTESGSTRVKEAE